MEPVQKGGVLTSLSICHWHAGWHKVALHLTFTPLSSSHSSTYPSSLVVSPFAWDFVSRRLSDGLPSIPGFLGSTAWLLTRSKPPHLLCLMAIFNSTAHGNAAIHNHDQFGVPSSLHVCGLWEETETWRTCRLTTELKATFECKGNKLIYVRRHKEISHILLDNTLTSSSRFAHWPSHVPPMYLP